MKKIYQSPDIEFVSFTLGDVLAVSKDENTASSGLINNPDENLLEEQIP